MTQSAEDCHVVRLLAKTDMVCDQERKPPRHGVGGVLLIKIRSFLERIGSSHQPRLVGEGVAGER